VQRDNSGASAYEGVAGASATVSADGWTQLFVVGTTTVTCTAKDAAGNTRTSTFDVVVSRKQAGR
jgi:endo-1,4-beta-xylanase